MPAWIYKPGAVRWRKHTGNHDVRATRAPKGWDIEAMILDEHPVTGQPLKNPGWWIKETYTGEVK